MKNNLRQLTQKYIQAVYKERAFLIKKEPFKLKSGKYSHLYLNHRQFLTQSRYLSLIATIYQELISSPVTDYSLGVVDSIMSPIIAGAISSTFGYDITVVKANPLSHGTQEQIYGQRNKPVILIDDMTSTGGTLIQAAECLRNADIIVNRCIISACRDTSILNILKNNTLQIHYIASFSDVIKNLSEQLSKGEKRLISKEIHDVT